MELCLGTLTALALIFINYIRMRYIYSSLSQIFKSCLVNYQSLLLPCIIVDLADHAIDINFDIRYDIYLR